VTEDYGLVNGGDNGDCINTNIPDDELTREVVARYTAVWHMDENVVVLKASGLAHDCQPLPAASMIDKGLDMMWAE
jgi:hypothetical protein